MTFSKLLFLRTYQKLLVFQSENLQANAEEQFPSVAHQWHLIENSGDVQSVLMEELLYMHKTITTQTFKSISKIKQKQKCKV